MRVCIAEPGDFDEIKNIYSYAREFMKKSGNPNQWKDCRPSEDAVSLDISLKRLYKMVDQSGRIAGVFAFILGDDPTYKTIDGKWLNADPYGTIHRIAAADSSHGIFRTALGFCLGICKNIRIDTHSDNLPMRHLLKSCGFEYCGIIITDDGTERMAFQLAGGE